MEIIQTINYYSDLQKFSEILDELSEKTNISGFRLNFCKYNAEHLERVLLEIYQILLKHSKCFKIMFDIPYPKNKTRILDYKLTDSHINQYSEYLITNSYDIFDSYTANIILINSNTLSCVLNNLIYFSDGQGHLALKI
jgi:hypothetical protein